MAWSSPGPYFSASTYYDTLWGGGGWGVEKILHEWTLGQLGIEKTVFSDGADLVGVLGDRMGPAFILPGDSLCLVTCFSCSLSLDREDL